MHARFQRFARAVLGIAVAASAVTIAAPAAQAVPALELPFTCGTSWRGASNESSAHKSYEIDFNMTGTEYDEDMGEPVLAAAGGTVRRAGEKDSDYGYFLEVDHGGGYSTLYAHLQVRSVGVGDVVRQGEQIGTVGNTDGNASIYAHLHFEFRDGGIIRPASFHGDPFDYATGVETYVSQNCGTLNRAAKSINGDRYDDAVGVDREGVAWMYPGKATGGFGTAVRIGPGWGGFSRIAVNDSNGDGWADLWAVDAGTLRYWHNRGNGTFAVAQEIGPGWSAFEWLSFTDVTGDNKTDVLARDGGKMYLYTGEGNGGFTARTLVSEGWASLLRHTGGDADADADGDVWATNDSGSLYFWKRTGSAYSTAKQVGSGWNAFRQMVAMDVNGDNKADLVAIRTSDNTLWQWLGGGAGGFGTGKQIGSGWAGYDLAVN